MIPLFNYAIEKMILNKWDKKTYLFLKLTAYMANPEKINH